MTTFEVRLVLRQGRFLLDVDVLVEARVLVLFGPSGSGKTSLVEAVAGLRTPEHGRIAIGDRVLFDSTLGIDVPVGTRRVGYVPQDVLLFPHLTVAENVQYSRRAGPWREAAAVVDLLELDELMDRDVRSLSGGERQRVALARALHAQPELLILDEPLAAVDLGRRATIIKALVRIPEDLHVPIVYVTHATEEAVIMADHALVIDAGHVVATGPPAEVIAAALRV